MSISEEGFQVFLEAFPNAERRSEGSFHYIFIPQLQFPVNGAIKTMDALLCPMQHSGYLTRLFLAEVVPVKQANWSSTVILGTTWHTWSWQGIEASLPLLEILASHLRALR